MASVPSLDRVNELLALDVETGILTWRKSIGSRARKGAVAGSLHKASGYQIIVIDGCRYRAHVLIWFMLTGEWCPRQVDHKDRVRNNNRPLNLRRATEAEQRVNSALRSDNTSGHRGVHFQAGKYVARTHLDGKEIYLGRFEQLADAAKAAEVARIKLYGPFAESAGPATR